jgi:hypothetical protein
MFTPQSLRERAAQENDPQTRDQALICAQWMEDMGHEELMHVGPFHSFFPKAGQKIRVRSGAIIYSHMSEQLASHGEAADRALVATVRWADEGFIDTEGLHGVQGAVHQGKINWAGNGGVWRWTDMNNVQIVQINSVERDETPPNVFDEFRTKEEETSWC